MHNGLAILMLIPGLVWGDQPSPRQGELLSGQGISFACIIDVGERCRGGCPSGSTLPPRTRMGAVSARTCLPWMMHFSCDYQICWGDRRANVGGTDELLKVLVDPSSHTMGGIPLDGAANFVSLIKLVPHDRPELYLTRGKFILEMNSLAGRREALSRLRWAHGCVMRVWEHGSQIIESSQGSQDIYRLCQCPENRLWCLAQDLMNPRPRPSPPVAGPAAPDSPASSRQVTLVAEPGVQDVTAQANRIAAMSTEDLRFRLMQNDAVRVDRRILTINGINPFASNNDSDAWREVDRSLSQEERDLLKPLRERYEREALEEARGRRPPREGMFYHYNDDTGQAEETPMGEDPGVKNPP